MTVPACADLDDAPTWTTAKATNGADVGWQPSPALRWRSWDTRRAEPGPWHVRHDRADGSKVVAWQADDVIDCSGDLEETRRQVAALITRLNAEAAAEPLEGGPLEEGPQEEV